MHAGTNDLWDIVPNPNPEPPGVRGNKVADKTIGLIQHILADTQAKVLVAKLIPMTRDQAVFNPNVIAYNEALGVKITMRQTWPSPNAWTWLTRVKIVDMYQAFQDGTDNDPKEVMLDGLHPDVPGNKILAYEWMAAIYANP